MEQKQTYSFDEEDVKVLADALAMYAAYQRNVVLPMLVGDESDADKIASETNTAERLARHFNERHAGESWEEMSAQFASVRGRPMDMNDLSAFDWFDYLQEENK